MTLREDWLEAKVEHPILLDFFRFLLIVCGGLTILVGILLAVVLLVAAGG